MIDHEDARLQLADLIVRGLADPTRTAALRAHVAVCHDCQAELADLQYVDGLVRSGGPLPEPSEALEARILEITGASRAPGHREALRRRARSITTWRVATIGLAVATAVSAVVAISRDGGGPAFRPAVERPMVTAIPYEGTVGTLATGTLNGSPALRIQLKDAPQPEGGSTFQVWIAQNPQARIALGTIQPDRAGNATVVLPVPASAKGYHRVWVTNEPADGDPKWTKDWIVKAS